MTSAQCLVSSTSNHALLHLRLHVRWTYLRYILLIKVHQHQYPCVRSVLLIVGSGLQG